MVGAVASPTTHRLLVLAAALLFSTGGTAVKSVSLSFWQIACFRSGIAALALALLMPSWRRNWSWRIVPAAAAYSSTMVLFIAGNKLTTAANTIFLQATAPLYLIALGPLLLKERPRRADLGMAAVLAAGMAMFFVGIDPPHVTAPNPALGNALGVVAGLSWALTIAGLRRLGRTPEIRGDSAGAAVVLGNLLTFAVCLPLALPVRHGTPWDFGVVTYLGVFQIGLAYVCMTRGVRHLPALEVSLLLLLEPVASTLLAWAVHGEQPGSWSLAGCSLILAATVARAFFGARARAG